MSNKLYFYYSTMNSGKSAHIIMQVHNLRSLGKKVSVLKPKIDTRDFGIVRSRALNTEVSAVTVDEYGITDNGLNIFEHISAKTPDYVFVDEVNFLREEDVDSLARIVDELNIPVFGYGLLVDYMSNQFQSSKRMIELSDSIRELKSPCITCGRKATMHLRKVNGLYVFHGESIQVGDTDSYDAVCRSCYIAERNKTLKR